MKNFFLFLFATLIFALPVDADSGQYGQYGQYAGGAPSTSIMIDKTVSRGEETKGGITQYVDNYAATDPRFSAGQKVFFQIKVKNTSNVTLKNLQVKDILPSYLDASEGPGAYDANTKTISWTYPELKAGEEKIEKIVGVVVDQSRMPQDKGLFCVSNKSTVNANNSYDEDAAQFCIEKQVIGAAQVPTACPEYGILVTALSFAGLGAGIYLKKKV